MIRVLSIALVLLASALSAIAHEEEETGLVQIQRVVSPGGIEAWLVQDDFVPLVAVRIGFFGGAYFDEPGKEGTALLTSWLMDEGAGEYDSIAFQNRLDDFAIRMGFGAGQDRFYASMQTLTENQDEAFDMLRLALTEPRFDPEPIERMRRSLLSGIAQGDRDPDTIVSRTFWNTAFGGHRYGAPMGGTRESVEAITAQDIRALHGTLSRDRMVIGVAGDIDPESLGRLLDETFGALPAEGPEYAPRDLTMQGLGETIVVEHPNPQSVVLFGSPGIDYDDPDYMAAMVMNAVLGGSSFSSRLVQSVRVERGLAYYVNSDLSTYDSVSLFTGSVGTENARVAESIAIIRDEIARLRDEGITEEELTTIQTYLTGAYALGFDSNSSIASRLVFYQLEDLGLDYINTRNARVNAVTRDDVARVAQRLLNPDQLLFVVVGQPQGLGEDTQSLDQGMIEFAPEPAVEGAE